MFTLLMQVKQDSGREIIPNMEVKHQIIIFDKVGVFWPIEKFKHFVSKIKLLAVLVIIADDCMAALYFYIQYRDWLYSYFFVITPVYHHRTIFNFIIITSWFFIQYHNHVYTLSVQSLLFQLQFIENLELSLWDRCGLIREKKSERLEYLLLGMEEFLRSNADTNNEVWIIQYESCQLCT